MPTKFIEALLPFLTQRTTEDELHQMIVICYEMQSLSCSFSVASVQKAIAEAKKETVRDNYLNNNRRNISLNQRFGSGKNEVSDWLDITGWQEWGYS